MPGLRDLTQRDGGGNKGLIVLSLTGRVCSSIAFFSLWIWNPSELPELHKYPFANPPCYAFAMRSLVPDKCGADPAQSGEICFGFRYPALHQLKVIFVGLRRIS